MWSYALLEELLVRWPANSRTFQKKGNRSKLTTAVQRLFHLETPEKAAAGTTH
jgi:hypothetical protein